MRSTRTCGTEPGAVATGSSHPTKWVEQSARLLPSNRIVWDSPSCRVFDPVATAPGSVPDSNPTFELAGRKTTNQRTPSAADAKLLSPLGSNDCVESLS